MTKTVRFNNVKLVADLHRQILDPPPPLSTIFFIFMHLSEKIGLILVDVIGWDLHPLLWIRRCKLCVKS